jgi:cold-inducible RNA-binding protein
MSKSIYVGNLPYNATESDLQNLFSQTGDVATAKVIFDKMSGRSKGFGFVEMADDTLADVAIEKLNGFEMNGRQLRVNIAKQREQ